MYGIYELPIDYGTRYFQSTILPLLMAILVRYLYWLTIVMGPLHTGIQSNTVPIACHFSTGTHRYGRVGVGHILCSIPPLPTRDWRALHADPAAGRSAYHHTVARFPFAVQIHLMNR